jgi:uncharacterized repeat protein (TIGR04052 family)
VFALPPRRTLDIFDRQLLGGKMMRRSHGRTYLGLACALALQACGSEEHEHEPEPFSLRFAALVDGTEVGCTDDLQGFGPAQGDRVGLNDVRFYVSNIRFKDSEGHDVALTLDTNEFQYASPEGSVALIDLTGNTEGSCGSTSVAYAEGTARTHEAITGTTVIDHVASISFDVGVPQALMKATIATNTPEGAPSPLNEMYWNWNSGYRHFVFNFSVRDATNATGAGYVHVGSRDCAPEGDAKALSDRDSCTFVNTPAVSLSSFDLTMNSVGIDLRKVVEGLDFRAPIYDPNTFEVIGEGPGVECHSSPMQPDCPPLFGRFGIDMTTGAASAATNTVFIRM